MSIPVSQHGKKDFRFSTGLAPAPVKGETFFMKTVAIIGANNDRSKFANKAVRAFQSAGYQVFPVNPAFEKVEELECFKDIEKVPVAPDVVSVYVGPTRLLPLLPAIAKRGCGEL